MSEAKVKIREEGAWVNAYLAMADAGDVHVASIRTSLLNMHPVLFEEFHALTVKVITQIIESAGGHIDEVRTERAPEHERAGHA